MTKHYNIIGDIHGRTSWMDLVDIDSVNVFVGDYFDPYDDYSFDQLKENFLNIIQFTKTTPGTILLLGNHDLHYIHEDDYSRFDDVHCKDILKLFMQNIHMFTGVAVALSNSLIVSHAGITGPWLKSTGYSGEIDTYKVADWCNQLFWDGYEERTKDGVTIENGWFEPRGCQMRHFMFSTKGSRFDNYGTTPTQSPVWVRPQTLAEYNAFDPKAVTQIVGHTQLYKVVMHSEELPGVIPVDYLGQDEPVCLHIEDNSNTTKFSINKLKK